MIRQTMLVLAVAAGLMVTQPLFAGEHGGKEHGGSAATQEHGGSAPAVESDAKVLKDAAAALRSGDSRPDLAAKLEKLAEKMS
jgi:hypothetical protein